MQGQGEPKQEEEEEVEDDWRGPGGIGYTAGWGKKSPLEKAWQTGTIAAGRRSGDPNVRLAATGASFAVKSAAAVSNYDRARAKGRSHEEAAGFAAARHGVTGGITKGFTKAIPAIIRLGGRTLPLAFEGPVGVGAAVLSTLVQCQPHVARAIDWVSDKIVEGEKHVLKQVWGAEQSYPTGADGDLLDPEDYRQQLLKDPGSGPGSGPGTGPGPGPGGASGPGGDRGGAANGHHPLGGVEIRADSANVRCRAVGSQSHLPSQPCVLLCFDAPTGLLFQHVNGRNPLVFSEVELATTVRWLRQQRGNAKASFSLDPTDPRAWVQARGGGIEGLRQSKWYSEASLKALPLGYWMWRADWKLKQLTQGVAYDDYSGRQQELCPGRDVPADFPDVTRDLPGTARFWIVCRGVTLRPLGGNTLLLYPADVTMGVERRTMLYNERNNKYEDAPSSATSPIAEYLNANYDALARFHPELQHCKRMAAALAVAHWLLDGPLGSLEAAEVVPSYRVPVDFPDDSVPALRARHEKGLPEKARLSQLRCSLDQEMRFLDDAKRAVELREQDVRAAKQRLDQAGRYVDQYDGRSVDAYNECVRVCNAVQASFSAAVDCHNSQAARCRQLQAEHNSQVGACNAAGPTTVITGGVNLDLRSATRQEPVRANGAEAEVLRSFRPLAEALRDDPAASSLLEGKENRPPVPLDDAQELGGHSAQLYVIPLASQPVLHAIARERAGLVVLHGLQTRADLNGKVGRLQGGLPIPMRDDGPACTCRVLVGSTPLDVKRRNFVVLGTPVRLVDLSDCMLNGLLGEIVRVDVDSQQHLRYVVRLAHRELAVLPRNVVLPLGSSVVLSGLKGEEQYNGKEAVLTELCPLDAETVHTPQSSSTDKREASVPSERKCIVRLAGGKQLKLKTSSILA